MFAVHQALLIGFGKAFAERAGCFAPARSWVSRVSSAGSRGRILRDPAFDRIAHQAVDPRVGHVAANDFQIGLFLFDGLCEVVEGAKGHLGPGQLGGNRAADVLDLVDGRRSVVVAFHDHGQVVLRGPISCRDRRRAVVVRVVQRIREPSGPSHQKSGGTGTYCEVGLQPRCRKRMPAWRKKCRHDP